MAGKFSYNRWLVIKFKILLAVNSSGITFTAELLGRIAIANTLS